MLRKLKDKVQRQGLHMYVRKYLVKPNLCQMCNEKPPYDLANITGEYTRDFKNWQYLCRKCHLIKDGTIHNLIPGGHSMRDPKTGRYTN